MLRNLLLAAAALALTASNSAASAATSPARDCFRNSQVNGWHVVDPHHVEVRVSANRHYILATDWDTHDLNWTLHVGLRSVSPWICTGNGIGVDLVGGFEHQTYPIRSITRGPDTHVQPAHHY